jgi:integrase
MARRAPVPRMADLEALLRRDYELRDRRSVPRLRGAWTHLHAHFARFDPARAYELTVRYALERRAEHAAPSTIRYEIALLGRALTIAARYGILASKPILARPTVSNARQGFLGRAEMRRLLAVLPQPVRDIALFAYVTGWRRREVLGLRWDHVSMDAGTIRLDAESSKNGEARTFPVSAHPELRGMLARRLLDRSGPHVFHRNGRPVLWFDRTWKTACSRAGLGHTLFHDLRRSAVRNMERAGVPRSVAMQLTGMKTESIYRRYAITNEEDLARGVRLIAALGKKERRRPSPDAAPQQETH